MNIDPKKQSIDGKALVYCESAFNTANGKTAHGLVRFTERYEIVGVIDSNYAGKDAGEILDGKKLDIPVFSDFTEAMTSLEKHNKKPENLVIGLAPDGGRLPKAARETIKKAIREKLNIASGLHDFLAKDESIMALAKEYNVQVKDIRRTPDRDDLHFFTGAIEHVDCLKLAVLGTDSAIGKRTTAWIIVHAFQKEGYKSELIGTGQTAWLQGARYSMIMDSYINDFVSGEIEHAVVSAYNEQKPDVLVIEGQGSLMNPAYPGGFEILAAGRPDYVILQHAPTRKEYDGFPGYRLHSLQEQINAIETISGKKVIAVTVNHEGMKPEEIAGACEDITKTTGIPAFDVLAHGAEPLIALLKKKIRSVE